MKLRHKLWTEIATLLGITSAFVSLAPINDHLRRVTFFVLLCAILIRFLQLTYQNRKRRAFNANFLVTSDLVHNQNEKELDYFVKICNSESEIVRVVEFDRVFFPEESFATQKVIEMWRRFPRAITYISEVTSIEILGLISIWPVSKVAYQGLLSGDWQESDVQPRHIQRTPGEYWWIGSLEIAKEIRKSRTAYRLLLTTAISNWIYETTSKNINHVYVVATAQSKDGQKLLKSLGFVVHKEKEPQTYGVDGVQSEISMWLEKRSPHVLEGLNEKIESMRNSSRRR